MRTCALILSLAVHVAAGAVFWAVAEKTPRQPQEIVYEVELVELAPRPDPESPSDPEPLPRPVEPAPLPPGPSPRPVPEPPPAPEPSPAPEPAPPAPRRATSEVEPEVRHRGPGKPLVAVRPDDPATGQGLDAVAAPARSAGRASTAKHQMTWRSLVAPEYGRSDFVGLYKAADGRLISIMARDDGSYLLHDSATHTSRLLTRREALHFTYGPDSKRERPVLGVVMFMPVKPEDDQDPDITWTSRLMLMPETPRAVIADKVEFAETEVIFFSAERVVQGYLVVPPGKGPFPGVVFVPTTACTELRAFAGAARLIASRGLAVLSYLPRGCKESEGEPGAGAAAAARDMAAAARALGERPEADAARIGAWGAGKARAAVRRLAREGGPIAAAVLQSASPLEGPLPAGLERSRIPFLVVAPRVTWPAHEGVAVLEAPNGPEALLRGADRLVRELGE